VLALYTSTVRKLTVVIALGIVGDWLKAVESTVVHSGEAVYQAFFDDFVETGIASRSDPYINEGDGTSGSWLRRGVTIGDCIPSNPSDSQSG
jgi:hypothetical protein